MPSKSSLVGSMCKRVSEAFSASSDEQRLRFTPAVVTLSSQVSIDCCERSVADEAVEN